MRHDGVGAKLRLLPDMYTDGVGVTNDVLHPLGSTDCERDDDRDCDRERELDRDCDRDREFDWHSWYRVGSVVLQYRLSGDAVTISTVVVFAPKKPIVVACILLIATGVDPPRT